MSVGTSVTVLRGFPRARQAAEEELCLQPASPVSCGSRVGQRCNAKHLKSVVRLGRVCLYPALRPPGNLHCQAKAEGERFWRQQKKPAVWYPGSSQPRSQRAKLRSMVPPGQRALCPEKTWTMMLIITTSKSPNVFIPGKTEKQRVSICHQPSLAKMQHPKYFCASRPAILARAARLRDPHACHQPGHRARVPNTPASPPPKGTPQLALGAAGEGLQSPREDRGRQCNGCRGWKDALCLLASRIPSGCLGLFL